MPGAGGRLERTVRIRVIETLLYQQTKPLQSIPLLHRTKSLLLLWTQYNFISGEFKIRVVGLMNDLAPSTGVRHFPFL